MQSESDVMEYSASAKDKLFTENVFDTVGVYNEDFES